MMEKEIFDERSYEVLLERTGLKEFPQWGKEIVRKPSDLPNFQFYNTLNSKVLGEQDVELRRIVGTVHPSYYGLSWNDMLLSLRRKWVPDAEAALRDFDIPNELHSKASFDKYGDEYFIAGGGNHRTCLAKFTNRDFVRAPVTEKIFDYELFESLSYLRKFFTQTNHHYTDPFEGKFISVFANDRTEILSFAKYFKKLVVNKPALFKYKIKRTIDAKIEGAFEKIFGAAVADNGNEMIRWLEDKPRNREVIYKLMETKHTLIDDDR